MCLEDLRVANMVRNHPLAKSISAAGLAAFRTTLECKAACAGKQVLLVTPHYPSQDRAACGERVKERLYVRTHLCPCCRFSADRDHDAALKIFRAGQALGGAVAYPAVLQRASVRLSPRRSVKLRPAP